MIKTIHLYIAFEYVLLDSACLELYKAPYNHVSIALDQHLEQMFSFGRRAPNKRYRVDLSRKGARGHRAL